MPVSSSSSAAAAVRVVAPIEQYLHNPFSVSDDFKKSDQDIVSNLSRFSPPKAEPAVAKQRESVSTRIEIEGPSSTQLLQTTIPPPPPPLAAASTTTSMPSASLKAPVSIATPRASDPVRMDPIVPVANAAPRMESVVLSNPALTPTPRAAEQMIPSDSKIITVGAVKPDSSIPPSAIGTSNKAVSMDLSSSSSSSSNNSKYVELQNELQYYKSKCVNLTEVVKDCETRLDDYKKMYMDSRESLSELERRLESREMEWREKLRGVELERDKAENDKRQARFALIDLEMKVQPSNADPSNSSTSSSSSSASAVHSKVPATAADLKALIDDVQVSKAALARSAASHMELQTQLQGIEKQHKEQLDGLITEHNHILLESASRHQADISEYKKRIYALEADQSSLNNMVDDLRERHNKEQQEHAVITSNMQSAQDMLLKRNEALVEETKKLQASYSTVSSELQLAKSQVTLLALQADGKLDAQRIQDETHQKALNELRSSESKLRAELAEKSKRTNEQQDIIDLLRAQLASSAAASPQGSEQQQQIPLSSFDQAVEHAAITRRQLEAEIDQLKAKIDCLEGEKITLVTQKSRQETEVRHAKAELNANASVAESNRLLELEKQQLMTQLQTMRSTNNECLEELGLLRKSYEQLLQVSAASRNSDSGEWVSKLEYDRVLIDLQSEHAAVEQLQKKIKSYQEELMCLQRRLEDKAIADALKEEASTVSSNKQQLLYEEQISRLALEIDALKKREGHQSTRIVDLQDEATVLRSAIAKRDATLQLKDQELQQQQQNLIKLTSSKPVAVNNTPVANEAGEGSVPQHLYKDLIQKKQMLESEKVELLVQINDVQHKLSMMTTSKLDSINTLKQQHHAEIERLTVSLTSSLEQEQSRAKVAEQVSTSRLATLQMELNAVYKDAELKATECFEAKANLAQVQARCGSLLQDMDAKEELIRQMRIERDELRARMNSHDSELRNVTKERDTLDNAVRDLKREIQELLQRSGRERDRDREGPIGEVDRYQLLRGEMDSLKASFASNTATAAAASAIDHQHHNKENIHVAAISGGNNINNMDFDKMRVSDAWGQQLQQEQQPIRLRDSHYSLYPPPPMHQSSSVTAFHADSNAKQIVELSWALSQQQLSMVRMEEYLLHTNKLIQEMKVPAASLPSTVDQRDNDARPTSAPASLRSSHRHHSSSSQGPSTTATIKRSDDAVTAVDADSSPDFMSLLRDKRSALREDDSSDSSSIISHPPVPIHHQKKNSRLKRSSTDHAKSSNEHLKLHSTRQAYADDTKRSSRDTNFEQQQHITAGNVLTNEALDRLIKKYELHRTPSFNSSSSKRGGSNNNNNSTTGFSVASANLSLMDVKSRTRREAKFMNDLRDLCQAAKKAILHDQACIRNLKDLWKSKSSSNVSVMVSAEMINSMTLKANIAVDALREGQELLKTRERKLRILSKSVEYFEQLLQQMKGIGGTATTAAIGVNTSHVQELLRVIQQHCIDSANDFTVILHSHANQQQLFRGIIDDLDLTKEPDYLSDVAVVPEHRSSYSHVPSSINDEYSSSSSRYLGMSDNHHHSVSQRSTNSAISRTNTISFTTRQPSAMSSATATALSQKETATGIALIRNKETRSRMLQDQIQKIAARQSQSKAECEKHFG